MLSTKSNFSFENLELSDRFKENFNETLTGYWEIQLSNSSDPACDRHWVLGIVQGKIVFSDDKNISWKSFVEILQRYIVRLRNAESKQAFEQLQKQLALWKNPPLSKIVVQMVNNKLFNHEEIRQALRSSILSDFDRYLFDYSGRAQFVRDVDILVSAPIQGFELNSLLLETGKRREVWQKIQETIPSLDSILLLKPNEIANSSLNEGQKQTISKIVGDGKSLENIARDLSKDNLDAAKMFFQLIQSGLIEIQKGDGTDSYLQVQPEIFIVDDSPLIVQQFRSLVTNWGYKVNFSNNALTAVEAMINSKPSAIFLDINMPGASGFDLIKQIRRQTKLASLPVVLLTAEKTVANQWRAQWANCRFLSKPRTSEEVPTFKNELQNMLQEMIPLKS